MTDIPGWIDLIEIRRKPGGGWAARLIGDRETQYWHTAAGTTARDSISGDGDTPEDAIAAALQTPGAYETEYRKDRRNKDGAA